MKLMNCINKFAARVRYIRTWKSA